jgi:spore germination protein YaaH
MDGSGTWVFQRTDSGYTDYRVWYDDEESLGPKYQMVREAGWGGECYPD